MIQQYILVLSGDNPSPPLPGPVGLVMTAPSAASPHLWPASPHPSLSGHSAVTLPHVRPGDWQPCWSILQVQWNHQKTHQRWCETCFVIPPYLAKKTNKTNAGATWQITVRCAQKSDSRSILMGLFFCCYCCCCCSCCWWFFKHMTSRILHIYIVIPLLNCTIKLWPPWLMLSRLLLLSPTPVWVTLIICIRISSILERLSCSICWAVDSISWSWTVTNDQDNELHYDTKIMIHLGQ